MPSVIEKLCPFCHLELKQEHKITHIDYHCYPPCKEHHYAMRVKDDNILMIKIRVSPRTRKIYLKIDYVNQYFEVWTPPDDVINRLRFDVVPKLNFDDLEKLENKLSTYLVMA